MHIVFTCGREPDYIRNQLTLRALRAAGQVVELTSRRRNTFWRLADVVLQTAKARAALAQCDLVWIGFWGHPLALLYRRLTRRPLVLDAFISIFNTVCDDRQWFRPDSLPGRLALWLDQAACRAADGVVVDTQAHAAYFQTALRVPAGKLRVIYVGCAESEFQPAATGGSGEGCTIFSYNSFLPLHGSETIIRAAKLLDDEPQIRVVLGGDGSMRKQALALATRLAARRIAFPGWIPFQELPRQIAQADICLAGPFGESQKAQMVVATKTYQFMAMGKAIIAADTPANREVLTHQVNACLVPPADPAALAQAIRELAAHPERRALLARNALAHYRANYSTTAIAHTVAAVVQEFACASA